MNVLLKPRWLWYMGFLAIVVGLGILTIRNSREKTEPLPPKDAESALRELHAGNLRFIRCCRTQSTDTSHDRDHRTRTAKGQHPFVAMLCCSDSRVVPEIIFDQKTGTIFEVRNAGNVVDEDVLASMEYAIDHLHVPLIVVLGHKGCGAIEAVCQAGERPLHDHLRELQRHMQGIHKQVIDGHHRHDAATVNRLSEENAKQQSLTLLRDSPVIRTAVERKECRLIYGMYDMETGKVDFHEPQP